MTTSHLTRLSNDDSQVIGYSPFGLLQEYPCGHSCHEIASICVKDYQVHFKRMKVRNPKGVILSKFGKSRMLDLPLLFDADLCGQSKVPQP